MHRFDGIALSLALGVALAACGGGSSGNGGGATGPVTLIAFDRQGDLHVVDPADGSSSEALDTFYDPGGGAVDIGRVSGAIYNPVTGRIWMGTGADGLPCGSCILALDVLTGEGVLVADNSPPMNAIPGMAISGDNRIFVHEGDGDGLFEVDSTSGEPTLVNATTDGTSGNGVTFSPAGALYLASDETLFTVDLVSFDATEVAGLTKSGFPADESGEIVCMTTRPSDGKLFAIFKNGAGVGGGGDAYLVTVDPATALMTYVGTMTENFDGLAFVPTDSLP